jgi:hypothetical protein
LARFTQLKAALSMGLFYLIALTQIFQIFAAYNMLAGDNILYFFISFFLLGRIGL